MAVIVNLTGNWRAYQKDVPPAVTILGTVHVNGVDGALVRDLNTGQFALMAAGRATPLNQHDVLTAWHAALSAPRGHT